MNKTPESRIKEGRQQKWAGRIFRSVWIAVLVVFVLMIIYPVNYRPLRIAELTAFLVLWLSAAYRVRKSKTSLIIVMAILCFPAICLILPAKNIDNTRLRRSYMSALCSYEGTRYWWGGENHIGIDCSGLVRRAMIDALTKHGVLTLNGGELRNAAEMWWYDASARALRDGFRGWTTHILKAENINSLDHSLLLPGDLAVTENGSHILAYLGDNVWIEADPSIGKVIKVVAPTENNAWFKMPVMVLRWRWLLNNSTTETETS